MGVSFDHTTVPLAARICLWHCAGRDKRNRRPEIVAIAARIPRIPSQLAIKFALNRHRQRQALPLPNDLLSPSAYRCIGVSRLSPQGKRIQVRRVCGFGRYAPNEDKGQRLPHHGRGQSALFFAHIMTFAGARSCLSSLAMNFMYGSMWWKKCLYPAHK
jgi:hypothetical protein